VTLIKGGILLSNSLVTHDEYCDHLKRRGIMSNVTVYWQFRNYQCDIEVHHRTCRISTHILFRHLFRYKWLHFDMVHKDNVEALKNKTQLVYCILLKLRHQVNMFDQHRLTPICVPLVILRTLMTFLQIY
jgi:hypothetical protein